MKNREIWANLFWIIVGVGISVKSAAYKLGTPSHPGAGFFPFWFGVFIAMVSVFSGVQSLRNPKHLGPFLRERGALKRILITFLSINGYILLVSRLGFLISTLLLMGFLLKSIYPQSWIRTMLFSLFVSLLSYFVFQHWLQVQLPKGVLGF